MSAEPMAWAGFLPADVAGALAFSVRGEYEHAPSAAGFSQAIQDAIQAADFKGPQPASPIAAFNRFRLLDGLYFSEHQRLANLFWQTESLAGPHAGSLPVEQ